MDFLKELIFTAILCGFIVKLSPKGHGTEKFVKYAASIAFMIIILSPLIGEIKKIPEIGQSTTKTDESTEISSFDNSFDMNVVISEICKVSANMAAEYFSVPSDDFRIKIIMDISDTSEYSFREVTVYTVGEASELNPKGVAKYFENILECKVKVIMSE